MKALIVDGEELYRLSMREVVSVSASFSEVIDAGSESEFIEVTARHDKLDLVVIHPDSLSTGDADAREGRNCLKLVRRLYPGAAIMIVTDNSFSNPIWQGATIVRRNAGVAEVIRKIRRALNLPQDRLSGSAIIPASPNVRAYMHDRRGDDVKDETYVDLSRLSFRQKQILAMAADGLPNKEIAARLTIAEGTVKAHMHAIFKVLDVSNRTQAVIKYGALNQPLTHAGNFVPQQTM